MDGLGFCTSLTSIFAWVGHPPCTSLTFLSEADFDVCAKVYIGNEKNVLFGHGRNNLDGRGRGHTDIANGFKLGGGVDVGNYRIAGIHFFKLFNNFSVHLLGHRTSCVLIGEVNGLFGGENLDRFGHKTHSAHYNGFVFNRRSLFARA